MTRTSLQVRNYLALALLAAAPKLLAQAAPQPAPVTTTETSEETIVLDPFSVSAADDAGGYQVKDTLGASRVRTEMKDVGSAITVVNAQFMTDIGAKNNEDLLKYTASTEVGGASGNFSGVGNSRQVGEADKLLRPNANTRVRGLTAADNTRDFFLTEIPWDGYIVDRVDIQRGPNAILFGMGSPAGIINSSLNEAAFKDVNKVEVRTDSESSYRASVDFNRVLLKKELALRFAGLHDHTYYRQKPAFSFDKRAYGALRYDPAFLKKNGMSTSLKLNFEKGDIKSNRPRSLTPGDQITPWFTAMGKKLYDPVADVWNIAGTGANKQYLKDGSANPNYQPWLGAYGNVYGNVLSVFQQGSTVPALLTDIETKGYWGIDKTGARDGGIAGEPFARMAGVKTYSDYMTELGSPYAAIGAIKDRRLNDSQLGVFDFHNKLLDGEGKREWRGFEAFNANLSQSFFDGRLAFNAAYDKQRYHDGQINGVNQVIYVDINSRYLDGQLNPNAGQAFVQSDNGGSEYNTQQEAKRVQAYGELRGSDFFGRGRLAEIIGRHGFTAMMASEEKDSQVLNFLRYAMDNAYADEVSGALPGSDKHYRLDSNERNVTMISYLSKNLSGISNVSSLGLDNLGVQQRPLYQGSIYRFDSRWKMPTNPTAPGYVNPGDAWVPPATREGEFQADNPANYRGWGTYAVNKFWSYEDGDAAQLYNRGQRSYRRVNSQAFVWQGYLLNEKLVPMVGWRRDEYRGGRNDAPRNGDGQISDLAWSIPESAMKSTASESLSYSIVGHMPDMLRKHLPLGLNLRAFYNRSSNIKPLPDDKDITGNQMANPDGKTKDYGFVVSAFDEKLSLKVNWFETQVHTDRLQGFEYWRISQTSTLWITSAMRVKQKDPANDWKWSAEKTVGTRNPTTQAVFDSGSGILLDAFTQDPLLSSWVKGWGYSDWLTSEKWADSATPAGVAASTDTVSKGLEFELNYQPTKNWNIAANVSKTKATQLNIGGALKEWVEKVDALAYTNAGDLRTWWAGETTTMRDFWNQNVMSQYNLLKLKEGSNVPELRPWRFNLVSNYNFEKGLLKGVNVGAAYRWESGVEVGYPVLKNQDGVYVYDVENPYKGPSEDHVDLWLGYGRKLTRKVDWRVQLNLRNAFANKRLIPVSVNPDGSGAAYRLPELTSWQLTNTFSF